MEYKLVSERTGETIVIRREPIHPPPPTEQQVIEWTHEAVAVEREEREK